MTFDGLWDGGFNGYWFGRDEIIVNDPYTLMGARYVLVFPDERYTAKIELCGYEVGR